MRFITTPDRSRNMRAVRGKHCKTTEWRLRALLISAGLRGWRMHVRGLQGSPDFYFPHEHVAVFVDGCFWHGCPRCGHTPKSDVGYWKMKLGRNKVRDRAVNRELRSRGFRVMRVWECEVRRNPRRCLQCLLRSLREAGRAAR